MIAFFDTNVHIDVLRGTASLAEVLVAIGNPTVRLSPVVGSELLRGVSGNGARSVMRLVRALVALEPPSWRSCWIETGRLLPRVFADHESVGLARLQNDLLLALTARYTGTLFVTTDPHFAALRRHVPFKLKMLPHWGASPPAFSSRRNAAAGSPRRSCRRARVSGRRGTPP